MNEPLIDSPEREKPVDLRRYLQVVLKRRWVILAVFAVILIAVALKTYTATPVYRATTRLIIEKSLSASSVMPQNGMFYEIWDPQFYNTQHKIIQSRAVAASVIDRLNLEHSEEFFPKPKDDPVSRVKRFIADQVQGVKAAAAALFRTGDRQAVLQPDQADSKGPDSGLISAVMDRITVTPVRDTRLVDVSFDAKDPVLAAMIANAVAQAYIEGNLETRLASVKDAVEWLSDRIEDERRKVNEAEYALLQYKERNKIITDFSSDTEQVTAQKLAQLNAQVVDAESARVEAETLLNQALALRGSPELIGSIPDVLSNSLISEIKSMEVDIYKQMSELSKKYGKNHPRMVALDSELKELNARKAKEVERVVNSLRNRYMVAQAKEESLKRAFEEQKEQALQLNEKAIRYSLLNREVESAREMYDLLVKRFKEATVAEDMKADNVRVIDRAEVPASPVSPDKRRNLLLALAVGLALGVGAAFLLEYLDNTIKLPEELKDHLDVAYLGPVPAFQPEGDGVSAGGDLACVHSPRSGASEAYRGIRTNLLFSSAGSAPQVILITSATPQDGKTVTTANLGVTMAQAGSRTVIIDCDLRKPKLHKVFGVKSDCGLTNLLVGAKGSEQAILATEVPGLDLIPSGPIPPNPSEMLGSSQMADLLTTLRSRYERILLDSPPVTAVTDATVLASAVDGVVLVIRAGSTVRAAAAGAVDQIRAVGGHILGGLLNAVDADGGKYYYQHYYYHYYGDDGEKKKKSRRKRRTAGA
ncbi:GumC family protein [Desulfatiglans anilini]|uniref:GumC family protein n=1 Tax=Desulfatiglans anilini TaxID=90728 RepID=UPI0003F8B7FB|nr:polysaccharide biosynthesis tyrosine autokinase [Desulfatiglans anilini]